MSDWYNPFSWDWSGALGIGSGDPSNPYRKSVANTGMSAGAFGDQMAAATGADTLALNKQRDYLQGQMEGRNSVSAEQLRQGLGQQLSQQQAMAAGASPNNSAMAARNAAQNMGQASYGMAGQQALAGLQERNQAASQLGQMNLGARGQDIQGTLGGYNAATGAYGTALGTPEKTWGSTLAGALGGAAQFGAAALSDERVKAGVKDGGDQARAVLGGLKAKSYKYKDPQNGRGRQIGVMAQDLVKAGLGHTVSDTPRGKMVDGAKLAVSNTALLAALAGRVTKLEGKKK